jgi:glycosyltransferase involved in cell wall biosynthesis
MRKFVHRSSSNTVIRRWRAPRPAARAAERARTVILFLHHRYRSAGGEERAVDNLRWLVREHLGEDTELLQRDSRTVPSRVAAAGLLAGGLHPEAVERAVRRTGARIVHAHNLHPTFGWRSLAAAQRAGARVVMHLHQYRIVCAIGVCFRDGAECTRCHGHDTLPGILLNCRGSRAEALAYGTGLSLWQRQLAAHVDAFVVPSRFARERLQQLGAPVDGSLVVPHVTRSFAAAPPDCPHGHALVVSRLAPEKGVDLAIEACRIAGLELVVAGDGPERPHLEQLSEAGATVRPAGRVRFVGEIDDVTLAALRASASVAVVPSRSAETFGLAAAEAMAAGLPVAATRIGALPELVPGEWLAPAGDALSLAAVISRLHADHSAGARALARARALTAPDVVAPALAAVYEHIAA